jgi:hypothetical protein
MRISVGRMSSVEFFAAIPPGLYVFLVSYLCFTKEEPIGWPSLWSALLPLSQALQADPPMIILALFGSYLFGSIIRSLPVDKADSSRVWRKPGEFPYPDVLDGTIQQMAKESAACGIDALRLPRWKGSKGLSKATFNYWKDVLCLRAPGAFAFYETFESRSRFFTGMFWAGCSGVLGAVSVLIRASNNGIWLLPALQLLLISTVLIFAFGYQLRRVREQEAKVLLSLFTALSQRQQRPHNPGSPE